MNLLIIDTETTGLSVSEGAEIIEIAGVLYNTTHKTILQQMSTLRRCLNNPSFEINGISVEAAHCMDDDDKAFDSAITMLCRMAAKADYIVAHNADFDKGMIDAYMSKHGPMFEFLDKKWVCTKNDFSWPIPKSCLRNLVHIAVALCVPVVSAHRALDDCRLIAQCFDKLSDLDARMQDALRERFVFRAFVSYDERELAKEHGFSWDAGKRFWTKRLTQEEADSVTAFRLERMSVCESIIEP